MRPGKVTIILCSSLLIFAGVITSKFLIFLNQLDPETDVHRKNATLRYPVIGKSADNLMWMMQISDLHISAFHDPTRISELKEFCGPTLDIIRPSVVLATGDLTDAKTADGVGSNQYEEEWMSYKDVLYGANVPNKVLWLDIRGNHDNFDVLCINSENNYFRKYSIQGPKHPRSYFYVYKMKNEEKVGFLGVDACLEVGARGPYNFVGELTSSEMDLIHIYLNESRSQNVNYMFWFGHYPTSTIQFPDYEKLRHVIADDERSVGYFCGHLHQIGGLVPNMYSWQKEGFFEMELGDWKGNRIIRVMAIDHGQFSFIDIKHGVWPIILVTHPKSVTLVPPGGKLPTPFSKFIRILIFNPIPIISVRRRIDNESWLQCEFVEGPLHVCDWNQNEYEKGLHVIEVEVIDEKGLRSTQSHKFSLDGTRVKTKFLARLFLMPNLGMMFYCLFTCTVVFCAVLLIASRYTIKRIQGHSIAASKIQWQWLVKRFRKIAILTYFSIFYYPLLLYPIYLYFGPWAIANLVSNNLGVIFSWGLLTNGTFIPLWISYPFGWVQIILHTFLIFHLAACLDRRYLKLTNKVEITHFHFLKTFTGSLFENKFFVFVLFVQIWDTYNFWLSFGHPTLIFCPLKTWWILMAIWLRCKVHTLPKEEIMHVHRIWYS